MLSNVWLSMPSSGRSGPQAPSALLSEGQRLPSSAARCFACSGAYALAASFLFRLPTVRLYQEGKWKVGMKCKSPHKSLCEPCPGHQVLGRPRAWLILGVPHNSPGRRQTGSQQETTSWGVTEPGFQPTRVPAPKHVLWLRSLPCPSPGAAASVPPEVGPCRGPANTALSHLDTCSYTSQAGVGWRLWNEVPHTPESGLETDMRAHGVRELDTHISSTHSQGLKPNSW